MLLKCVRSLVSSVRHGIAILRFISNCILGIIKLLCEASNVSSLDKMSRAYTFSRIKSFMVTIHLSSSVLRVLLLYLLGNKAAKVPPLKPPGHMETSHLVGRWREET